MMASGRHAVVWDARDDAGHRAASGVYFSRLEVRNGESSTSKVSKLTLAR
jgi:hypothetical protein